jgi:hypothetical protein
MEDLFLTSEEYAKFGLSQAEGEQLYRWVFERVGYVVGADGRGGSAVFVRTPEGRTALLTASHVVIRCILTGEIQVAALIDGRGQFKQPLSIRLSIKCDAALLTMRDDFPIPACLEPTDWDPDRYTEPPPGTHVIAAGMPGMWKAEPDVEKRRIDGGRTLLLWTEAKAVSTLSHLIEIRANKRIDGLPTTLRGMSGGPLFTTRRELLGVLNAETLDEAVEGSLFSTGRNAWRDLFHPWVPDDVPSDLRGVTACCDIAIGDRDKGTDIPLQLVAELFGSPSNPNHRHGGVGRIISIEFYKDHPTRQCLVNVEWIFHFDLDHQEAERKRAFEEEIRPLLSALSIVPDRPMFVK